MEFAVFFSLFVGMINCINLDSIDNYVTLVCGGEKKCYDGGKSSIPRNTCCRPCECDDICLEKGTCCDDRMFNETKQIITQKCLPPVYPFKSSINPGQFYRYFVRTHCPERYGELHVRNKCENDEPESLEDIPFVSSKDGKIVYKNRHCAVCYGEKDVIPWNLIVDWYCIKNAFLGTVTLYQNASYTMEKLVNDCSLSFERPAETEMRYTVCRDDADLISSCNKNKPMDNAIETFKAMCLNDTSATFYQEVMHGLEYANVYCYLCNTRSVVTCELDNSIKALQNMLFLLDTSPFTDSAQAPKTNLCKHAEVFDDLFGVCRPIHCPLFQVPVKGKCTSVASSSKLNFGFYFELVQTPNITWQHSELFDFFNSLYRTLPEKIGFEQCSKCKISLYSNSAESLHLKVVITTSRPCKLEHVYSLAASLEDKDRTNQSLTYVYENITILIKYIWSEEMYRNILRKSKVIFTIDKTKCLHSIPSTVAFCPKVALTVNEYNTLAAQGKVGQFQATHKKNGSIEICYDDYRQIIDGKTSNCKEWKPCISIILSAAVLLLSFK